MSARVCAPKAVRPRKPLFGLRRRPGRIALAVFRMPLRAYRHGAGWMLGHVFLEFVHTGRRSGRHFATVAMVLAFDEATREAVICSGWGSGLDWVRNLRAGPAVQLTIGRESFTPVHRFLGEDEAVAVVARFRRDHPYRLRLITAIFGWGDFRDDAVVGAFVQEHPFVAFRPA